MPTRPSALLAAWKRYQEKRRNTRKEKESTTLRTELVKTRTELSELRRQAKEALEISRTTKSVRIRVRILQAHGVIKEEILYLEKRQAKTLAKLFDSFKCENRT